MHNTHICAHTYIHTHNCFPICVFSLIQIKTRPHYIYVNQAGLRLVAVLLSLAFVPKCQSSCCAPLCLLAEWKCFLCFTENVSSACVYDSSFHCLNSQLVFFLHNDFFFFTNSLPVFWQLNINTVWVVFFFFHSTQPVH